MKKLIVLFLFIISFSVFGVIVIKTPQTVLNLLNWGEYINYDLVEEFEDKFKCRVNEEIVESSEEMYSKIKAATTPYDIAIPGDYIIYDLYHEGLIQKINTTDYINISKYNDDNMFNTELRGLMKTYMVDKNTKVEFNDYYMPYFWGAYSIIYSTNNSEVENVINEYGFKALYDRSLYNSTIKIGMYKTPRWIVMSYLLSQGLNPNITTLLLDNGNPITSGEDMDSELIKTIEDALLKIDFDEFEADKLKRDVASGKLDMCFAQLGDFFDALNLKYSEKNNTITFNVSVPDNSAAFFDAMVIPTNCQNYSLACEFINFMLDSENAYENACEIGYCPTLIGVADKYNEAAQNGEYFFGDEKTPNSLTMAEFLNKYPCYLNPITDFNNSYLLQAKDKKYLTTCQTIRISLAKK